MTNYSSQTHQSSDGEVPGSRAFYAAIIIAVAMLLMGTFWQMSPHGDQVHAATQQAEIVQSGNGAG